MLARARGRLGSRGGEKEERRERGGDHFPIIQRAARARAPARRDTIEAINIPGRSPSRPLTSQNPPSPSRSRTPILYFIWKLIPAARFIAGAREPEKGVKKILSLSFHGMQEEEGGGGGWRTYLANVHVKVRVRFFLRC